MDPSLRWDDGSTETTRNGYFGHGVKLGTEHLFVLSTLLRALCGNDLKKGQT
jgi:hypothetical protein